MSCRAGFIWSTPVHFNRFIEECGIACETVTPHMLAAPFFRSTFNCLIIPTGFANPAYSNLLPALRASSARIRRFVENGGSLLVFGAAADKPDAYDWLWFRIVYRHDCHPRCIEFPAGSRTKSIVDDYDPASIECDGSFPEHDCEGTGMSEAADVILERKTGRGRIVITSIHEYPSREFLKSFCAEGTPTLF
jgi:hypothetical protein